MHVTKCYRINTSMITKCNIEYIAESSIIDVFNSLFFAAI